MMTNNDSVKFDDDNIKFDGIDDNNVKFDDDNV